MSEVGFSGLVPVHPGLVISDYGVQEVWFTVCGVQLEGAMIEKKCREQRVKKPKVAIDYNKIMGDFSLNDPCHPLEFKRKPKEISETFFGLDGYLMSKFLSILHEDGQ